MLDIRSFCSPTHAPVSAFIKLYLYSRHPSRVLIAPSLPLPTLLAINSLLQRNTKDCSPIFILSFLKKPR